MRPVAKKFPISQPFGSGATAGVDPYGSHPMAPYVRMYGDYQPYGHAGLDIACPVGTPVYAMAPGRVLWADWGTNLPGDDSGAGWASRWYLYKGFPGIVTVIQHPWGIGVYAHLSDNNAAPAGTVVKEGDLIGLSGDTGGVAPHLHVEALLNLSYVTQGNMIYGRADPVPFFGNTAPGDSIGTQGTTTPKENTLSAAEVAKINAHTTAEANRVIEYIGQINVSGYTVGDQKFPGMSKVDIVNQQLLKTVIGLLKTPDLSAEQITDAVAKGMKEGVDVFVGGKPV